MLYQVSPWHLFIDLFSKHSFLLLTEELCHFPEVTGLRTALAALFSPLQLSSLFPALFFIFFFMLCDVNKELKSKLKFTLDLDKGTLYQYLLGWIVVV